MIEMLLMCWLLESARRPHALGSRLITEVAGAVAWLHSDRANSSRATAFTCSNRTTTGIWFPFVDLNAL